MRRLFRNKAGNCAAAPGVVCRFATGGSDKRRTKERRAHEKREAFEIATFGFVDLRLFSRFTKHFGVPFVQAFKKRDLPLGFFVAEEVVDRFVPLAGVGRLAPRGREKRRAKQQGARKKRDTLKVASF